MKTKVITVATSEGRGLDKLRSSVDVEVLGMGTPWKGFGTKIILTRKYLQTLEGYSHFIFTDAYDTFFLNPLDHIEEYYQGAYRDKIVFSTEKACWPDPHLANAYPNVTHEWKYLNSGGYMAPIDAYLAMIDKYPLNYADDDQRYFTNIFLNSDSITLDYSCYLFQSVAFRADDDFNMTSVGLFNKKEFTYPSIVHGNGRTPIDWIVKPL